MRKFYLLTSFFLLLFHIGNSQDTASFTFTVGLNNMVVFTNTSHLHGDAQRKAVWLFGDGGIQVTAPLAGTTYQYGRAGTYTACLKIYKYNTATHDSVVTADVCKTIALANTTTPDSCHVEFSNTGSSATSLTQAFAAKPWHNHGKKPEEICWNFGDSHDTCIKYDPALSSNYAVYHTFSKPGQYNVCVRVRYQGGCISESCRMISFPETGQCKADFTMEPVNASPLSRHFVAQPAHSQQKKPVRICWDFGDGSTECKQYLTTTTDPYAINHTYAKPGQYTVCVGIQYDGGCEAKSCKAITIETPQKPDTCFVNIFEIATNNNNLERHFYAGIMQDRRPETICWIFGDGRDTCISLPNPMTTASLVIEHRYPAPGVYTVCVKVKYAGGCVAQKCREVVIVSTSNACGGYMVDSLVKERTYAFKGFSIQNPNDHPVTWRWTFGDGTASSDRNVIHTYTAAGNYEVCLYIKTDLGCETRICKHVVVQGENRPILKLTPNPVTSTLHAVFLSALQEQVAVNIYNANGILVRTYSKIAVLGTNTWDFDVSILPTGVYSVIVISPHQLANAIFFKQ